MVRKVIVGDIRNDITRGDQAASLINDIKRAVNEVITFGGAGGGIPNVTVIDEPSEDIFNLSIGDYSIDMPSIWNSTINLPSGLVGKTAFIQIRRLEDNNPNSSMLRMVGVIEDNSVYFNTRTADGTNSPWVKHITTKGFSIDRNGVLHEGTSVPDAKQTVGDGDVRLSDARGWNAPLITKDVAEAGTSTQVGKWSPNTVWQGIKAWWEDNTTYDPVTRVMYSGNTIPLGKKVITTDDVRLTPATVSKDGLMTSLDKIKLNNIEHGAQVNPPVATPSYDGLMSKGDKIKLNTVQVGAQKNPPVATIYSDGLLSAYDKAKLISVQTGAQKNPPVATSGRDGLFSSADKVKLEGIEVGAQVNPPVATPTSMGLMSIADKTKLDSIDGDINDLFKWGDNIIEDKTFISGERGQTFMVMADSNITVPLWSDVSDGWYVRLLLNNTASSVGILSQESDDIVGDAADIRGVLLIIRSTITNEWIVQPSWLIEEAPIDGKQYMRGDGGWVEYVASPAVISQSDDAEITNIQDRNALVWDNTLAKWVNSSDGITYKATSDDIIPHGNNPNITVPAKPYQWLEVVVDGEVLYVPAYKVIP